MFLYSPISSRFILADRWFGTNPKLLEHIDSLGHHYVLHTNGNTKVFYKPTYEKHKIWSTISNLPCQKHNSKSFENLYSITCFAVLFLTIYGTYYEKNKYKVFRNCNLKTSYQKSDKSRARYMSLFNTGLTFFKLAINSSIYISIPYTLKLYDI